MKLIIVFFALAAVPWVFSPFWTFVAIEILALGLYAASFNLMLGYAGMLSFGHAAYFGLGGYTAAILIQHGSWPFIAALPAAPLFASLIAALIGLVAVRRIGIYFAMLTFAFQMLLFTVVIKWTSLTGGFDGMTNLKPSGLLGDARIYYYFALAVVGAVLFAMHRLIQSRFGYAMRAMKSNPQRLQSLGVNVYAHQWATFVLAGGIAGLAGGLFIGASGNVFPNSLDWHASATPVMMTVLGGIGVFFGPLVGAAVYVVLEIFISGHTEYWSMIMGVVILALILALPKGLIGWWRTKPEVRQG